MTDPLPVGWSQSDGSSLFELITSGSRGWATYHSEAGPLFIRIGNLDHGTIDLDLTNVQHVSPPKGTEGERTRLRPGDILISITAELGMTALVPGELGEAYINQHVALARPIASAHAPYLARFFAGPGKARLLQLKRGATKVGLGLDDIRNVAIDVPPLNEQRRIVAKIDALTAKSRRAKEALAAIPPLLDKLRQSILAAAFRGDLTADWRAAHPDVEPASQLLERIRAERRGRWEEAELAKMKAKGKAPSDDRWKAKYQEPEPVDESGLPELPEGWCWASIGQVASDLPRSIQSGPFGSNLRHEEFQSEGILAIGIDNVRDGTFSIGANHRISEQKYEQLKKYAVRPGDFLITVMATVGRCCVVPDNIESAIVTKHVYRVTVERTLVDPELLVRAYQGAPSLLTALEASVRGQTRAGINGEILRNLAIPIPPISEQMELLRSVRHAFELLASIEQKRSNVDSGIQSLESAVLAKAFRGELVSQDPSDESASVLLERIRTESSAQPQKAGRRRKVKTA